MKIGGHADYSYLMLKELSLIMHKEKKVCCNAHYFLKIQDGILLP